MLMLQRCSRQLLVYRRRPISTSKVYEGDKDIYAQFRNRDRRLYYTVTPPYKVKITGSAGTSFTWDYTDNSKDREYIDLMKTISSEKLSTFLYLIM